MQCEQNRSRDRINDECASGDMTYCARSPDGILMGMNKIAILQRSLHLSRIPMLESVQYRLNVRTKIHHVNGSGVGSRTVAVVFPAFEGVGNRPAGLHEPEGIIEIIGAWQ